jgi:hypothetical protein
MGDRGSPTTSQPAGVLLLGERRELLGVLPREDLPRVVVDAKHRVTPTIRQTAASLRLG